MTIFFLESLKQKKHITIFGSSKQGKTCLRKKYIRENKYITVHCGNITNLRGINEQILKQAGYEITLQQTKSSQTQFTGGFEAGVNIFVQAKFNASVTSNTDKSETSAPLNLDIRNTNDIIKALQKINFEKIILIEDFHYLNHDTQLEFVNSLKIYYDESHIKFIIVGVWLDENKIITLNGDLAGRVVSLNADKWDSESLKKVIERGCEILNIEFDDNLIDTIIEYSFDNIYIVQELCLRICKASGILRTYFSPYFRRSPTELEDYNGDIIEIDEGENNKFYIAENLAISDITKDIVNQHSGRYNKFIAQFVAHKEETKIVAKELIKMVVNSDVTTLQDGFYISNIIEKINKPIVDEVSLLPILNNIIEFQTGIKPMVLDFDKSIRRLSIVDREFIIWVSYADPTSLNKFL